MGLRNKACLSPLAVYCSATVEIWACCLCDRLNPTGRVASYRPRGKGGYFIISNLFDLGLPTDPGYLEVVSSEETKPLPGNVLEMRGCWIRYFFCVVFSVTQPSSSGDRATWTRTRRLKDMDAFSCYQVATVAGDFRWLTIPGIFCFVYK